MFAEEERQADGQDFVSICLFSISSVLPKYGVIKQACYIIKHTEKRRKTFTYRSDRAFHVTAIPVKG